MSALAADSAEKLKPGDAFRFANHDGTPGSIVYTVVKCVVRRFDFCPPDVHLTFLRPDGSESVAQFDALRAVFVESRTEIAVKDIAVTAGRNSATVVLGSQEAAAARREELTSG